MDPQQPPDGLVRTKEGFYVLRDDSHLSRWVEEHGRLDVAEGQIEFYKKYIPVGGIVIDAGASLGDHVLTYAKLVGPTGFVLAFEPNPLAYVALELNFKNWKNVSCVNRALSDDYSYGDIYIAANAGASFVTDSEHGNTRLSPLDPMAKSMSRCDLIHLDVEGFEIRAIRGASQTIKKFKPAIVLEINHACLARNGVAERDVLRLIDEMGYRWEELEPHLNTSFPQRDILCLPK